jgi:hypothetical protein
MMNLKCSLITNSLQNQVKIDDHENIVVVKNQFYECPYMKLREVSRHLYK